MPGRKLSKITTKRKQISRIMPQDLSRIRISANYISADAGLRYGTLRYYISADAGLRYDMAPEGTLYLRTQV